MIEEILNRKNLPALTSDNWHVVHARRTSSPAWRNGTGKPSFERTIVSEHADRATAAAAAREISLSLAPSMAGVPREGQDQVFVRHPNYKSLKVAKRVAKRRK